MRCIKILQIWLMGYRKFDEFLLSHMYSFADVGEVSFKLKWRIKTKNIDCFVQGGIHSEGSFYAE
jgi:hypothetical protein